jgi:hypothetical protein
MQLFHLTIQLRAMSFLWNNSLWFALKADPTVLGVAQMIVELTERKILLHANFASGLIEKISDVRDSAMLTKHVGTLSSFGFERLSTQHTAKIVAGRTRLESLLQIPRQADMSQII